MILCPESTDQQKEAFEEYLKDFKKYEISPSEHSFIVYYGMWCAERKLTNDLISEK